MAPIRGWWWVWVHPCAEKKKRRKRQNKVSNPLGPNFCKAHISKLVCARPFFLLSLQSPHQIVPKNTKKIFAFFGPPPKKNFFSGHAIIKIPQTQEFSVFISYMMLIRPKNGLTYTQNDREKWRNTLTMIVSASLHVLVTEKVQQAGTITLAPRCSHAWDSPGPAMVEFLSNPFIPCNLRPKYLKTGGVYPPIRRAQCDRRGASLGKRRSPVPRGAALSRCPGGKPPCNFGRLVGPCCP